MGLFSKLKHGKDESLPGAANNDSQTALTSTYPSEPPPPYSTDLDKVPQPIEHEVPQRASSSRPINWPISPHTVDYEQRKASLRNADGATSNHETGGVAGPSSEGEDPQKKNWLKKTFGLAGPEDPEYYERRYGPDGNGSDWEKKARIAQTASLMGGGLVYGATLG